MGQGLVVGEVVHRYEVDILIAGLLRGTKNQAPDAPKSIDGNSK
jgi:hypothetical protein